MNDYIKALDQYKWDHLKWQINPWSTKEQEPQKPNPNDYRRFR
jgi:hypothetical protein